MTFRIEQDYLGEMEVPSDALYGIHALRAKGNFPCNQPFNPAWYKAMGVVKKAAYLTYDAFRNAALEQVEFASFADRMMPADWIAALCDAAGEVAKGDHYAHCIVPAISGGAGTSINMNVNEIIANRARQILTGQGRGAPFPDPVEHANVYQSTNDVVPAALKIAAMRELETLEASINGLRFAIEAKEKEYRDALRVGYTQMQAAVPSSFGILFSTFSDALSRDWWRVSKSFERIKVVNLGGGAIGTGMAVPRFFIMEVVNTLRELTGLPVARAENLPDNTANLDALVEVHAVMKALAVNLEKMAGDLRLLASDLSHGGLSIPHRQVGSSIMPGKINPVIPEYVISISHRVYANDSTITSLSAQGCLELNAYLPIIGDALLNSLQLLQGACNTLRANLVEGITINVADSENQL
ncbi:MAG TPA: lyase family protein, partial [Bacteroidales bacterium]|nr:lyase family protein [Bacteroidales bacterium]